MVRATRQRMDRLSPKERDVAGNPDEYDWDNATELPPRAPGSTQFSLRVERQLMTSLQELARIRSTTLSTVAREALEQYVASGGRPGVSNIQVSFPRDVGVLLQAGSGRTELSANRRNASPDEQTPVVQGSPGTF